MNFTTTIGSVVCLLYWACALGCATAKHHHEDDYCVLGAPHYAYGQVPDLEMSKEIARVSLIALIASPEKYDGKIVAVTGFVVAHFEGTAIYLHPDFAGMSMSKEAVWLGLVQTWGPDWMEKEAPKFDGEICLVIGTFHASNKGHMSASSGAIDDIVRIGTLPHAHIPALDCRRAKEQRGGSR
jgi:hypothetical protein